MQVFFWVFVLSGYKKLSRSSLFVALTFPARKIGGYPAVMKSDIVYAVVNKLRSYVAMTSSSTSATAIYK